LVRLDFKVHDRNETLIVEVSPEELSTEHWQAACGLARRTANLENDQS
jgi:hypothetical protein